MAPRKFHEKVETWIVVTVIAVLVWLYAEATVLKSESRQVQVLFDEPTGNYVVEPAAVQNIRVTFRASSGQIQQMIAATSRPLIIELEPTAGEDRSERFVNLQAELLQGALGELGITDLQTEPEIRSVVLRRLESIALPIQVDPAAMDRVGGIAAAVPDRVTVTAPADVIQQIRDQPVLAMLSEAGLDNAEPGREAVANNIVLQFPVQLDVTAPGHSVEFRTVQVNYTPASNTATTRRERVPLFINLPVDQQAGFVVQPTDGRLFLRDVTLVGPADVIAAISSDDPRYSLWAELMLTDLDRIARSANQTALVYPVIRGAPNLSTDPDPLAGIEVTVRRRGTAP
jgi:hypothetical protein